MPEQGSELLESRGRRSPAGLEAVGSLADLDVMYRSRDDSVHAVRGLDLELKSGEIVALVGESGSGKTSVALALLGLLTEGLRPPGVSGEAQVLGIDMLGEPSDERRELRHRRLGAIFQDPTASLNPTMTIGKQLIEVAGTPERAAALLDEVGVPEAKTRLRSYPHELSGGQRQRVMIAMAIAGDPALVVADEPTTALDVTIQAQILQLLARLRDELGCAFLVVTHDLGVAAQIADRIAVCYAGTVVEIGGASDVLQHPTHPYTAGLMRSRITLDSDRRHALTTLPGEPPDMRRLPPGCPFAPRCEFAIDKCTDAVPPLVSVRGVPQQSACIRAEELGDRIAEARVEATAPLATTKTDRESDASTVRLTDLHKSYKLRGAGRKTRLPALRGLDLEVGKQECVAVVGESGCGKSTLLRIIAGLTEADRGSVELRAPDRPQMVFQDASSSLTPWLTVGEQIEERLRSEGVPGGEIAARTAAALERVGLSQEVARSRANHLSGGQQQRIAIARAIAVPPSVLLCDEPTSSLDVSLAATVLNLLGDLREELGMTVIFVTHDLAVARFVADRVAVMYLGRIVEIGPAEEVARAPVHPYTQALLSAVPDLGGRPARAKGELPSPLSPPSGCPYHPRCIDAIPECSVEHQPLRRVDKVARRHAACLHVKEPSE